MNYSLIIRPGQASDEEAVRGLYYTTFAVVDGCRDIDETTRRFLSKIARGRALVAVVENNIVGFVGYDLVKDVPPSLIDGASMEKILNRELAYARRPADREVLLEYLRWRRQIIGRGEMAVEAYDNEFTTGDFPARPNDLYFTDIAVVPELQGNGVAKAMIQETERGARQSRISALYVHCWCGGYSPATYQKLGFQPILKIGPEYEDGSASLLMGKRLALDKFS